MREEISVGLVITKPLTIRALENSVPRIITNASYGIVIEGESGGLENSVNLVRLFITGGVRSQHARTTDAAVVVRGRVAFLVQNIIANNDQRREVVLPDKSIWHDAGIAGIAVRERGSLWAVANELADNSWDGIAFYRDSGHSELLGNHIWRGANRTRSAAIGVVRGSDVVAVGNTISAYGKGVLCIDSKLDLQNSIIEFSTQYGLSSWHCNLSAVNNNISFNAEYGMRVLSPIDNSVQIKNNMFFNNTPANLFLDSKEIDSIDYNAFLQDTNDSIAKNICLRNSDDGCDEHKIDGHNLILHDVPFPFIEAVANFDYHQPASALLHQGDPTIRNRDQSRSDIGITGGPKGR